MADNKGTTSKANIPKLDDTNFLNWLMRMEAHLRHKGLIKYITEVPAVLAGAAAEAVNEKHAETVDILMNFMSETAFEAKGKKKGRRGPYSPLGKLNPEASHDAKHCWQLHPELRPDTSKPSTLGNTPINQLVEVDDGHESEVLLLLTEAASKPTILDSGATHHFINNPDVFSPTAESNVKILTGGHSNFLNATAVGTATLINHCGGKFLLKNTFLVPSLTWSLISIPRLIITFN
ncbi:hypothetical protein VP01_3070g1 [Puccinia sorghi]|uniref:Retrovirus-related Pol polyprotein from transposon TNT 1-94-like beta-barrel domain-containing protein n=1 Tax=Puccinia sorghi TaxID=27349 RepID=A0A0L6UZR3_9BASI|nr:hypothetical protein VP01_3070g1 [Puccinia sorghi]